MEKRNKGDIKDLIEHSKKNPTMLFIHEDGKHIFDGQTFYSKEDLDRFVNVQMKAFKFFTGNRFFRFLFGIKKK